MAKTAPAYADRAERVNGIFHTPDRQRLTLAVTACAVVALALVMRLPFVLGSAYPLNDGGMFAQIVDELRAHHFALPHETSYNFEHIPLCYPPLGFYFGAIWCTLFQQSSMQMLRWVPLLCNLLCLPAVFLLALELLGESYAALAALAVYAVLPRSAAWLTMGGGLTRAPGELFAILAIWLFVRAAKRDHTSLGVAAGVLTGLAILTHLEAGTFCVASLIFLACAGKQMAASGWRTNVRLLVVAGAATAVVIAPWFLWAVKSYGLAPFRAAFGTRGFDGSSGVGLKAVEIIPWVALAAVMAVLRKPPFILWVLAIDVFVARSSQTHTVVPLSMFAGWLVLALSDRLRSSQRRWFQVPANASITAIAACLLLCGLWTANYLHHHLMPHDRLHSLLLNQRATLLPAEVEAMRWVRTHTPASARFVVYNQRSDTWAEDFLGEWFPYLAQRASVLTAQGREWLPGDAFNRTVKALPRFTDTFTEQELETRLRPGSFDYLLLAGPFDETHTYQCQLFEHLPGFSRTIYKAGDIVILARRSP